MFPPGTLAFLLVVRIVHVLFFHNPSYNREASKFKQKGFGAHRPYEYRHCPPLAISWNKAQKPQTALLQRNNIAHRKQFPFNTTSR